MLFLRLTPFFLSTALSWGVFRSRTSSLSIPDGWVKPLDHNPVLNDDSENFTLFFEIDEAYETALAELNQLSSKSSYHKIASESLVRDCRSIGIDGEEDENSRILFGVQLAACEFEVDGLEFPYDCRRFEGTREKRVRRARECFQKLARKSQWWTSYSNNRANGFSMYSAAKRKIEKGIYRTSNNRVVLYH